MSDDRFDPRFDPAFQRGYDGPAPATGRSPAPRAEIISPPPSTTSSAPTPRAATEPASDAFPFEAVDVRRPDLEDDDEPRRINPFLVVLGVVSLVLVGGGLYLVSRVRDLFAETQSSSDFDYVTLQVLMDAAPLIVVLGLAIAVGILFIFAVRWKPARD